MTKICVPACDILISGYVQMMVFLWKSSLYLLWNVFLMFDVESVNLLTAVLVLCCLSSLHVVDPHFSVDLCHLWLRIMTAGIGLVWTMSSSHASQIAPGSPFVLLERGERCQLRWKQVVRYSVDNGDGYLEFIKRSWLNRTLQASNVMIPQSFK